MCVSCSGEVLRVSVRGTAASQLAVHENDLPHTQLYDYSVPRWRVSARQVHPFTHKKWWE